MELEVIVRRPTRPGSRPPLLFVHGAWSGAWMWDEHFLPFFAHRGWEVHALSLRGHAGSPAAGPLRWVGLGDYAQDVERVAASLPRRPVVIGHSMGGAIVQRFLAANDVEGAALLCSVPPGGTLRSSQRIALRHPIAFLRANLTLSPYALVSEPETAHDLLFSPAMPMERFRALHARFREDSSRAFLEMYLPVRPVRREPDRPLLVLGAGEDRFFDERDLRDTAAAYGTTAEVVPGLGHTVMLEPAWATVAERLASWLDAHWPADE